MPREQRAWRGSFPQAPGVLLQKSEYAKIVLQHRHLPSENGRVDVVEFTDPGLRRRLGCRGFLAGLGHDSVSVAERRASASQQALLMEITLERTSFSCEERSKLGQDLVYAARKTHDDRR